MAFNVFIGFHMCSNFNYDKKCFFQLMYFSYPIRVKTSGTEHTLGTNSCEKGKRKKKKYILCTIEEDINNNQLIQERF